MKIPPLPSRDDEEKFFAALGRAVTDWAHLDTELFKIVHVILGCAEEMAAVVFYHPRTISVRLDLTDDLVSTIFPRTEPGKQPHGGLKVWRSLKKEIGNSLGTRNHMAHHPVAPVIDIFESKDGSETRLEIKLASYMGMAEHLKAGELFTPLDMEEIQKHTNQVAGYVSRLRNFRFCELSTQIREYRSQSPRPHETGGAE